VLFDIQNPYIPNAQGANATPWRPTLNEIDWVPPMPKAVTCFNANARARNRNLIINRHTVSAAPKQFHEGRMS
jgi:hypothetical protein